MTEEKTPATTRLRPRTEPCLNCGDRTPGEYCPSCGQRKTVVQVAVSTILSDVLKDEMVLSSALPRTAVALLFQPGRLTNEYIRGRVVRYIPPLRLYLVSSILFFLVLSMVGLRALDRAQFVDSPRLLPSDPDSARAVLLERQARLQAADTAAIPGVARVAVTRALASTALALDALGEPGTVPDSVEWERVRHSYGTTDVPDSVAGAQGRQPAETTVLPPGTLQPWAQDMHFTRMPPLLRRAAERKRAQLGHLPPREAVRAALNDVLNYAPHATFLMLPIFALMLKLLYIRRDRFYAEHFIFALHTHAFFFVMFLLILLSRWEWLNGLLPSWLRIDLLLALWMMVYVWLAMKRVYRQGWFRTTVKWWVLGFAYMNVLTFGAITLLVATLLFA